MLPPFDDRGYLPPGIHECSFDELAARFGSGSPERIVQIKELRQFIDWCRQSGICRVIVNGSFVTPKASPIDVDVVILPKVGQSIDTLQPEDEDIHWPFLQILVAVDDDDFMEWASVDFATDRQHCRKGVVEVRL